MLSTGISFHEPGASAEWMLNNCWTKDAWGCRFTQNDASLSLAKSQFIKYGPDILSPNNADDPNLAIPIHSLVSLKYQIYFFFSKMGEGRWS